MLVATGTKSHEDSTKSHTSRHWDVARRWVSKIFWGVTGFAISSDKSLENQRVVPSTRFDPHFGVLRSADQNVWMVPLAGSCLRILYLTGWSRFSIAPTRALLLNTSMNNDEFSLCKFSERPALPQKNGNQPTPRFLPRWRWFRDVAVLCSMNARDVSSRWISACWISTSQCWFWSSLARRSPQKVLTKALKWQINSWKQLCPASISIGKLRQQK